jgi:hypothetical protein
MSWEMRYERRKEKANSFELPVGEYSMMRIPQLLNQFACFTFAHGKKLELLSILDWSDELSLDVNSRVVS